jgi:hypothetical protein
MKVLESGPNERNYDDCPFCGTRVKEQTLYNLLDRENEAFMQKIGIPKACKSCSDPWPDCESSCPVYDD